MNSDKETNINIDPFNPDSDGDGYWDGWIGIFGVGRTDNTILYIEHLRDFDDTNEVNGDVIRGVRGEETIEAQMGVHKANKDLSTTSSLSADLYDNNTQYHSNVHIGELIFGDAPDSHSSTPNPSYSIEIDYYEGANDEELNGSQWEELIENNLNIYGIDANVIRGQTLTENQVESVFTPCPGFVSVDDGFQKCEILALQVEFGDVDLDADDYALIVDSLDSGFGFHSDNAHWISFGTDNIADPNNMNHNPNPSPPDITNADARRLAAARTLVHEIGHHFHLGEADEDNIEVYTGDINGKAGPQDITPEYIEFTTSDPAFRRLWSSMSLSGEGFSVISAYGEYLYRGPINGRYTRYSIEEISSYHR